MKQTLLVVNAVLVVAVSYLLYKQFSPGTARANPNHANVKAKDSASAKKLLFAYMNMDSIQSKYELAKAVTREVEKKRESFEVQLGSMEKAYRNKLEGYQKRTETMTEEQMLAAREDMANTEKGLMEKRQAMESEFQTWLASKNMSVIKEIQDYLKKFNADKTYSFIFSHETFFYYSDTAYDITNQVIKGLNDQYKAKKDK